MLRFFIFNWPLIFRVVTGVALTTWLLSVSGFLESQLFYFPSRGAYVLEPGQEEVTFETRDGLTLHGIFWKAQGGGETAPTVLFVHGNMGNAADYAWWVRFLPPAGFNVLAFDYRGFGPSERPGKPFYREDLIADVDAAIGYLLAREDVDHERIALYGMSLGAALGVNAAAEREEVRAVVFMAGFADWRQIASDHVPWLGKVLIRAGHEPAEAAARLGSRPLLIVHGEDDRTVGVEHALHVAAAAREAGVPVQMRLIPHTGHINMFGTDEELDEAIAAFLREAMDVGDEAKKEGDAAVTAPASGSPNSNGATGR